MGEGMTQTSGSLGSNSEVAVTLPRLLWVEAEVTFQVTHPSWAPSFPVSLLLFPPGLLGSTFYINHRHAGPAFILESAFRELETTVNSMANPGAPVVSRPRLVEGVTGWCGLACCGNLGRSCFLEPWSTEQVGNSKT